MKRRLRHLGMGSVRVRVGVRVGLRIRVGVRVGVRVRVRVRTLAAYSPRNRCAMFAGPPLLGPRSS